MRKEDFEKLPFNKDQLIELFLGYLDDLDISRYADAKLSADEMRKIRVDMSGGVDKWHSMLNN